ncbi:apical protein-like (Xenopus laevis) [Rattus norvegicus]|uniref:Apical protein-like (Xenopus laevis) n=1 Tax=Rattus norvegicus TaxID=10116 RepID=A6K2C5_RAT|nr:apical protein-like (Xenopus laevis) [Rattus norvegicus]
MRMRRSLKRTWTVVSALCSTSWPPTSARRTWLTMSTS